MKNIESPTELYKNNIDRWNELNQQFNVLFDSKKPFSIIRMGHMEGNFINYFSRKLMPPHEHIQLLEYIAGVYPSDINYLYNVWFTENINALKNCDILGFVDFWKEIINDKSGVSYLLEGKQTFFKDDIEILDPVILSKYIEYPWTRNLQNKKVLVISSFPDTIKEQWNNRESIWGESFREISNFELVDVIRSPYHPALDERQLDNCSNWHESLQYMKDQMDAYHYDVLLVGAAAYAPALANHAKNNGKIGITICGAIQLFFGILGERWVVRDDWNSNFNNYWTFPNENELPKNKFIFEKMEGRSYW